MRKTRAKLRKAPRTDTAGEESRSLVCHGTGQAYRTKAVRSTEIRTLTRISLISTRRKKSIVFGNVSDFVLSKVDSAMEPLCLPGWM